MKRIFLLFTLLSLYLLTYGQGINRPGPTATTIAGIIASYNPYGAQTLDRNFTYEDAMEEYSNIQGSPYLYGKELIVDLVFYTDTIINDIEILYDQFNHEVVATNQKGEKIILDQIYYKGFNYDNDGRVETFRRAHPTDHSRYFKIIFSNDDFTFCRDNKIRLKSDKTYFPGDSGIKKQFSNSKKYYIVKGEEIEEVKLRNDAVIESLPKKYQARVAQLKKKLKLKKLSKEEDYYLLMSNFQLDIPSK